MAGRPRKAQAVSTGKISTKEKITRQELENKNKVGREQLENPTALNLTGIAKDEYYRVVEETKKIDLLDNLDLSILTIYCNAYAKYLEVTSAIEIEGVLVKRESSTEVYYTANPLIGVQEKMVKQIMQCSSKLGLATTDRLKLIVPVKEEKTINKYLSYLK